MKNSIILLIFITVFSVFAGDDPSDLYKGLARKYPGDKGLSEDKAVVFVEDFSIEKPSDLKETWNEVKDQGEVMSLCPDTPPGSEAQSSLKITHKKDSTGGHLYRMLKPGYERLFLRFYVKISRDCEPLEYLGHLGGYNPPTPWPQGSSGSAAPDGAKNFRTGIVPRGRDWRWDFVSKYSNMHKQPNNAFWNNDFIGDETFTAARGEWICVELMVKMNTPGKSDGEQALWINGEQHFMQGQLVSHLKQGSPLGTWVHDHFRPDIKGEPFEGYIWRTVPGLNINYVWLSLYVSGKPEGTKSELVFSNIVAATKYIGPIYNPKTQKKGKPVSKRKAVTLASAHPLVKARLKNMPGLSVKTEFDEEYRIWTITFCIRKKELLHVTVTEFGKVTDIRDPEEEQPEKKEEPKPSQPEEKPANPKPDPDVEVF